METVAEIDPIKSADRLVFRNGKRRNGIEFKRSKQFEFSNAQIGVGIGSLGYFEPVRSIIAGGVDGGQAIRSRTIRSVHRTTSKFVQLESSFEPCKVKLLGDLLPGL